jgi:hypothetical protein
MYEISWLCDGRFVEDLFLGREDAEDFAESLRGMDISFVMREVSA